MLRIPGLNRNRFYSFGLVALPVLMWEGLARAGLLSPIIFPAPSLILRAFVGGLIAGEYAQDLRITLSRVFLGFLIGGGCGLLLGLGMGWSRAMRETLDPIIAALHPIPKFALLPMVIIFFGIGETSRIAMVSIATFFPLLISTMYGVLQIPSNYFDVVKNYGGTRLDLLRKVVLPGSFPFVMTGARLSLQAALTITIGVELVFSNSGLGSILWMAWNTMRMTRLYSVILIVAIIGVVSTFLLEKLKRYLSPWHREEGHAA